jgi:histone deacetylase 6
MDIDSTESDVQQSSAVAGHHDVPTSSVPSTFQINGDRDLRPLPSSLEAFQRNHDYVLSRDSPLGSTPGITGEMTERLVIESTSDDDDDDEVDSLPEEESVTSEGEEANFYGLPISSLPTGLCYDDRMRYHAEVASTSETDMHPEDPRRIYYIFKELTEAGLAEDPNIKRTLVPQPLLRIDARQATREECLLVHTLEHYDFVKSTRGTGSAASDPEPVCLQCLRRN